MPKRTVPSSETGAGTGSGQASASRKRPASPKRRFRMAGAGLQQTRLLRFLSRYLPSARQLGGVAGGRANASTRKRRLMVGGGVVSAILIIVAWIVLSLLDVADALHLEPMKVETPRLAVQLRAQDADTTWSLGRRLPEQRDITAVAFTGKPGLMVEEDCEIVDTVPPAPPVVTKAMDQGCVDALKKDGAVLESLDCDGSYTLRAPRSAACPGITFAGSAGRLNISPGDQCRLTLEIDKAVCRAPLSDGGERRLQAATVVVTLTGGETVQLDFADPLPEAHPQPTFQGWPRLLSCAERAGADVSGR